MTAEADVRARALVIVREQLAEATAARKCHACGCLQQTVAALAGTTASRALAGELERARSVFVHEEYDCLGCAVCYPAVAASAFTEAFPGEAADLDLCPVAPPARRAGWPPLAGDYRALRFAAPVAVCTLNDEALATSLAEASIDELAIVGTMRTENLGIERVIKNVLANPHIRRLMVCGEDAQQAVGHLPGQSLLSLFENGIDERARIRGAKGKRPVLKNVSVAQVEAFLRQVTPVSMLGENDPKVVRAEVQRHGAQAPGRFEGSPAEVAVPVVRAAECERLVPDPAGYFVVYPDRMRKLLLVEHYTNEGVLDVTIEGTTPTAIYATIVDKQLVSRLDHAAYLGRELARADHCLETGEAYVQDRAPGRTTSDVTSGCGCSSPCGSTAKQTR